MSLRQLKFKPKIQLSASKNATDANSGQTVINNKVQSTQPNVTSNSVSPVISAEACKKEVEIGKKNEKLSSNVVKKDDYEEHGEIIEVALKSNSSESSKDNSFSSSDSGISLSQSDGISHDEGSKICDSNTENISSTSQVIPCTIILPSPDHVLNSSNVPLYYCNKSENNEENDDPLSEKKTTTSSLINYDVLKSVNLTSVKDVIFADGKKKNQIKANFFISEQKETVGKSLCPNIVLSSVVGTNNHSNQSETKSHSGIKPVRTYQRFNVKPNLGVKKNEKKEAGRIDGSNLPSSRTDSDESNDCKVNEEEDQKPVRTYHRANFKPNLATLDKIKRPEKFATSSYSKMESLAKQQFIKKFGNKGEPDTSKLTMMDLIFYNPSSNPMPQACEKKILTPINGTVKPEKKEKQSDPDEPDLCDKSDQNHLDKSDDDLPVPQLKISSDGKVIVAQESLVIKPSHSIESATFEMVVDGDFKKRKPVKNPNRCGWSHQETVKFYKALNSLGSDFETMQTLFPDRSRKNLKSKFKREEKLHGNLINKVLSRHSEFNLTSVVEELEIDALYQNTIKTCGKGVPKKRPRGRRKSLSSLIAGEPSELTDEDEFPDNNSSATVNNGGEDKLKCNSDKKDGIATIESENTQTTSTPDFPTEQLKDTQGKRKRRKSKENVDSDNQINKKLTKKNSESNVKTKPKKLKRKKKKAVPNQRAVNNNIIIRLEDLINFNEAAENEVESKNKLEVVQNQNHIVINTNIEFDNVKYTRYISYNSNNLENPIEINETVAHAD